MNAQQVQVEVADSVSAATEQEWDHLLDPELASPFLEWRFLRAFEEAGTLGQRHGWIPKIVFVRREGKLVAAAPLYVKFHSHGEFVFDFAWAEFAARLGLRYYPKLLVGVPFTPVTGQRLLTAPGEDRPFLMRFLAQTFLELMAHFELSSVHVNFTQPDEIESLKQVGFLERLGLQYHFSRGEDASFADYLARFNSKKRNQIKRERRALEEAGIVVENLYGERLASESATLAPVAHRIYRSTVEKFAWGRLYLNQRLFELWFERLRDRLEIVVAKRATSKTSRSSRDDIIAGAINFSKGRRLYGRYWGCFEEHKFLHFNVCYYQGIESCFERGLDVFEPGAQGEHKLVRGFSPTVMRSAHYLADPRMQEAISRYLDQERRSVLREREIMLESMLRSDR